MGATSVDSDGDVAMLAVEVKAMTRLVVQTLIGQMAAAAQLSRLPRQSKLGRGVAIIPYHSI
jgi:hypothetical protein